MGWLARFKIEPSPDLTGRHWMVAYKLAHERAMADVQQRLRKSADEGMTIFLSTHILDMAERLCSRIGIIHHGELVATGSPSELKSRVVAGGTLEEVFLAVTEEGAQP